MKKVGFFPPPPGDPIAFYRYRPTRARQVLSRVGIQLPKPKRWIPREVWIGFWRPDGRQIRLSRVDLFERIWSVPVETIAKEWGLSGRGLAKACRRLRIPVPPRGFWARIRNGQKIRRPRLPNLEAGEAEEIVIRAPHAVGSDQVS